MIDRWRHIRNSWGRLETRLSVAVLAASSPSSLVPRVKERTLGTRLKSFSFQFRGDSLTLDLPRTMAFPLSLDIPMQIDIIKEEYARSGRFSLAPNSLYDTKGPLRRRELKYVIPGSKETVTNIVKLLTKATTKQTCSGFAEPLMARLYMTLNSPCASGQ